MQQETFLNRDNENVFGLLNNGVPVDATVLTRVVVRLKAKTGGVVTTLDSSVTSALFDFTTNGNFAGTTTGVLRLIFGAAVVGEGKYRATLIVYDATNPAGVVWAEYDHDFIDDAT